MSKEERNKLSKLKKDVDFLDSVTFEKVCSFNQCIAKFEPHSEVIEHRNRVGTYLKDNYFHKCRECGRRMQGRQDKKKTYNSVMTAITSGRYAPSVVEEEKGLQLQIAERERKAVIETIDELMGMESDRHPMFSEGYDYALDHIKQFVRGRDSRDKEEKNT